MKSNDRLEIENSKKAHYFFIGKNYKKLIKKLDEKLSYFRLVDEGKFVGKEVVYDVQSNMLSNAGLVLSKQYEDDQVFFKIRKISSLTGGYKRPSQKFSLGQCEDSESPKDFPLQIANAISNSFSNSFTIDLVSIVRQTMPKIEITVKGKKYRIKSGTGYEAQMLYENAVYKDLTTNKKVAREGFTFKFPTDAKSEKESQEIIEKIDHYCKELVRYEQSRFEIAQRLLYPLPLEEIKKQQEEE